MKDITITGRCIRRETLWLSACFVIAFLINVYAVVSYHRHAIELFSQLGFVVVITVALYIAVAIVRVVIMMLRRAFRHINRTH